MITTGWWITGVAGQDEFAATPPSSLAVAGPLARGAVYLTMGQPTGSLFALSLIPGMLLGALGSALFSKSFRWIAPAGERVGAYVGGGVLMGIGAVFAGGCNVGPRAHRDLIRVYSFLYRCCWHVDRHALQSLAAAAPAH